MCKAFLKEFGRQDIDRFESNSIVATSSSQASQTLLPQILLQVHAGTCAGEKVDCSGDCRQKCTEKFSSKQKKGTPMDSDFKEQPVGKYYCGCTYTNAEGKKTTSEGCKDHQYEGSTANSTSPGGSSAGIFRWGRFWGALLFEGFVVGSLTVHWLET